PRLRMLTGDTRCPLLRTLSLLGPSKRGKHTRSPRSLPTGRHPQLRREGFFFLFPRHGGAPEVLPYNARRVPKSKRYYHHRGCKLLESLGDVVLDRITPAMLETVKFPGNACTANCGLRT